MINLVHEGSTEHQKHFVEGNILNVTLIYDNYSCLFCWYLRAGGLFHDLQQQRLVLVAHLIFCVSQSINKAGQNWGDTQQSETMSWRRTKVSRGSAGRWSKMSWVITRFLPKTVLPAFFKHDPKHNSNTGRNLIMND